MQAKQQDNWKYFGGALFIHALIAMLFIGIALHTSHVIIPQLAIKATLVDRNSLNPPAKPPEPEAKPDEQQKAREEEQQKKQAEKLRIEQEEAREQVKEHELELKRVAEAKQQETQRKAAAEMQRQNQEADKKRVAEIQQKQHELEQKRKVEADAKAQAAREAEMKTQLADEERRTQAVNAGMLNQYMALIRQRVERNWSKPASVQTGLQCEVHVTQAVGGMVLSVSIGKCNGDEAVRQSVESAVYRSSPLPAPPDMHLFERDFKFIFKPTE